MVRILILTSTFLSAFLLFVVQPLFAKFLLPYFGGTSSVWTISVFFYSVILLFGYIYAALLAGWKSKLAWSVHSILLVLAGAVLLSRWLGGNPPLLVDAVSGSTPALSVLLTLSYGVGLPVLLLASTSVVTQHLYSKITSENPYRLYALSNLGSLLGLAAYPFLFEPFTTLSFQSSLWMCFFVLFLVTLITAWRHLDKMNDKKEEISSDLINLHFEHRGAILIMAAIPTFLLVAVTEHLSRGIASFPLLWIVPLMLYLISFILTFRDNEKVSSKVPLGILSLLSLVPVLLVLPRLNMNAVNYWIGFLFINLAFFTICVYFHKRIYLVRPRVQDLGSFYVWLTLGGSIGSGIVGLVLPFILDSQIELYIGFGLLILYFSYKYLDWLSGIVGKSGVNLLKGLGVIAALTFILVLSVDSDSLVSERNFFGTLRVENHEQEVYGETVFVKTIVNGATNHGMQASDERYYKEAASYYGPDSGIDIAIRSFADEGTKPRVSVVGLGAGMMNAYCDEVESISYIEINPVVEIIARTYFTYLDICPEKTSVEIGDGRLLLEEKVLSGDIEYDLIMMDAFTDDSIPSHLLTIEAFLNAYQPLLSDKGIVAFHVTNKYLNLYSPIAGMAREAGYDVVSVKTFADKENELYKTTVWVLVAKPERIQTLLDYKNTKEYKGREIVWTDEKNSVMSVLSLDGSAGE